MGLYVPMCKFNRHGWRSQTEPQPLFTLLLERLQAPFPPLAYTFAHFVSRGQIGPSRNIVASSLSDQPLSSAGELRRRSGAGCG